MNLTKEQVKQHLFEEVEYRDDSRGQWHPGILQGYEEDNGCQYIVNGDYWKYCRLPKPKAKRLLTVKEIWGRTLIHSSGSMTMVNKLSDVHISVFTKYQEISELHFDGWRLADESLEYENATSLEVEA